MITLVSIRKKQLVEMNHKHNHLVQKGIEDCNHGSFSGRSAVVDVIYVLSPYTSTTMLNILTIQVLMQTMSYLYLVSNE